MRLEAVTPFESVMTQAAFARYRGVSKTTVLRWIERGHVVLTGRGKVDVADSEKRLDKRPEVGRGGRVKQRPSKEVAAVTHAARVTVTQVTPSKIDMRLSPVALAARLDRLEQTVADLAAQLIQPGRSL